MATLTYDKAAKIYKDHAKKLEKKAKALDQAIKLFVRGARKAAEATESKKEGEILKNLEKELSKN